MTARARGFSLLEIIVLVAVLAIAGTIAVTLFARASRTAAIESAAATVGAALRRASQRAAATGENVTLRVADLPVASNLLVSDPRPLAPAGASVLDVLTFAAGTGYPLVGATAGSVAVVVGDGGVAEGARAIVVTRGAGFQEFRFTNQEWKETTP